jgi:N-acetylglucosaminyldiphosphoundecaprenol N-acetyl-beta-D-mannosaminyltransferase
MKVPFYNIKIDNVDESTALSLILETLEGNRCQSLFFINAHCFNVAQKEKNYFSAIHKADIVLNDGVGVKIAGKLAGINFSSNLNGTDLIPKIIQRCVLENESIYLIGSKIDIVKKSKLKLEEKFPEIQIRGFHDGFFSIEQEADIIHDINQSGAKVVIVGMGVPLQELWINRVQQQLSNVRLCIAGGAIIDFISEEINRAPFWVRAINMEWFFRLLQEPKRLWKRYLIGNLLFFYNIFRLWKKA